MKVRGKKITSHQNGNFIWPVSFCLSAGQSVSRGASQEDRLVTHLWPSLKAEQAVALRGGTTLHPASSSYGEVIGKFLKSYHSFFVIVVTCQQSRVGQKDRCNYIIISKMWRLWFFHCGFSNTSVLNPYIKQMTNKGWTKGRVPWISSTL